MLEPFGDVGHELERESLRFLERFARIDQDARSFVVGKIAQHAQAQIQILIEQRSAEPELRLILNVFPQLAQIFDVWRIPALRTPFRPSCG